MPAILDQFATADTSKQFYPQTVREFFALRLAQRLGDAAAVPNYVPLAQEYSEEILVKAYRQTVGKVDLGDLTGAFHAALERVKDDELYIPSELLLAMKIERRSVSAAIFAGTRLDYTETRHLSSSPAKAEISILAFINSTLNHFSIDVAAAERIGTDAGSQRTKFIRLVNLALHEYGLPVKEVDKADLLDAYGVPAPSSRRELRAIVRTIWPALPQDGEVMDAVALGLYTQVEHLLGSAN